jgi:hypothetical protein
MLRIVFFCFFFNKRPAGILTNVSRACCCRLNLNQTKLAVIAQYWQFFNSRPKKAQTPLVRYFVDLLYNKLYSKSTTNPLQIEQVEFELEYRRENSIVSVVSFPVIFCLCSSTYWSHISPFITVFMKPEPRMSLIM